MQWYGSILPRVQRHLPAGTVLEIACGYGRWTNFLRQHCDRLIGVDLVGQCVQACRKRFDGDKRLSFVQNDGRSLEFVQDGSVDFVFSFDSLVHVDPSAIHGYLSQFSRILRPGGTAFLHHSNLAAYPLQARILYTPKVRRVFSTLRITERQHHNRDPSMSAERMVKIASDCGLTVSGQECVTWRTRRMLLDCLTTLQNGAEGAVRQPIRNRDFMREASMWKKLRVIYGSEPPSPGT
jgi:SAM-dependent methyltransferase